MNEFELSTLVVVCLLLLGVGGYSYAQIFRAQKQVKAKRQLQSPVAVSVPELPDSYHPHHTTAPQQDSEELVSPVVLAPSDSVPQLEEQTPVEPIAELNHSEELAIASPSEQMLEHSTAIVEHETGISTAWVDEQAVKPPTEGVEVLETESRENVEVIEQSVPSLESQIIDEQPIASESPIAVVAPTHTPISSMQELTERASWAVFAPWMRFESWLNTAYPEGVDVVHDIDGVIDITIAQPKITQDIEQALFDLQLNTKLPIHLYGARAGRVRVDANPLAQRTRQWEQLEAGAPYSALRLSLQLANRTHCVNEALLQDWFALAEKLRKRLAGQIERLPDATQLTDYARYLHGVARRLGQPIVVQLHKKNGLWPAYEIHQQLTACGAVLNESGVYVVRDAASTVIDPTKNRAPIYTVMNDVNNPRALDFFRDQMAMMHVHTVSFCLEFARVDGALRPLQRMCGDARQVAEALDAQWQNGVGDAISPEVLFACMDARTQAFNELLNTLGLPAGALVTKRLLAQ